MKGNIGFHDGRCEGEERTREEMRERKAYEE